MTEIKKENINNKEVTDTSTPTSTTNPPSTPFVYNKNKKKPKPVCLLCKRGCLHVNYKDTELLKNYLKKYNKILTHKISGNCFKHQHQIANAIKRARFVALLPFVSQ